MAGEWAELKLSELSSKITKGTTPTRSDGGYSQEGVNFLKAEAITDNGNIDHSKLTYVSEGIHEKYRRSQLEENDILFTMAGVLGRSTLVKKEFIPANTNQAIALIRPITDHVFPKYLFYALRHPELIYFVNNSTSQSAQPNINLAQIGDLGIKPPPLPEQKAIAHVLGALDDKIELNRRMNETLEGMAQALFKSWFVDFDPVIDNALAASNPIPEPLAQRAETRRQAIANGTANRESAQAFPASFRFTEELGWIPEGWEVKKLRNYSSTISKGTTPRKKDVENADDQATVPFIKVRDITDEGELIEVGLDKIPRSIHQGALKRSILQSGDVLFSIAGTIGRVTILPESLDDSNSNQAIAFIRPENTSESNFLLEHLKGEFVQNRIHSRIVQAVQANVSLTELGDIPTITPIREIMKKWSDYTDPIYRQVIKFRTESQTLAKLRDVLLPKLISGELRIPQAEKMVEKAVA